MNITFGKLRGKFLVGAAVSASLFTAGCVTDPNTGQSRVSTKGAIGGAIGALGGYLLGDLLGGRNDRTAKILGAGIGAVGGAVAGTYMDKQQKELEQKTSGSGVSVDRQGDQIVLNMPGDVTFATASANISPQFQRTLDGVAQTLANYPSTYIDIYGHTDSRGADDYNMQLSQRRAYAVQSYLASRGVNQVRMAATGYGETQLKCAPERTDADYQCNRRVEIRVVPVTTQDANQVR